MDRETLLDQFLLGWVEYAQVQLPLLAQLQYALHHGVAAPKDGNSTGSTDKPKSKPPTNLEVLDLYTDCKTELAIVGHHAERDLKHLIALRDKVRLLLGYETPMMKLTGTSCHQCGGQLVVAADASTDAYCTTENCTTSYSRNDWADILLGTSGAT